jgi:DUF4097 and DUF4098 domain-containing protein YvlB
MMTRALRFSFLLLTAGTLSGCVSVPHEGGSFEQSLTVTGPLDLEVNNGSGDVRISTGPAGQVQVRGEFEVNAAPWESTRRIAEQFKDSPPVEQQGNAIRIGRTRQMWRRVRVHFTIVVPADTHLRVVTGSGEVAVRGTRGPARLRSGSGAIEAEDLGGDAELRTGSGDIRLRKIAGRVRAGTGSGDLMFEEVGGELRAETGSGSIRVNRPAAAARVETGSGEIEIRGARADLAVHTGSGDLLVEGDPPPQAFWDIRTGSGDVRLNVPPSASFTLVARARHRRVEFGIPIEVTERSSREVRGRAGKGEARIVVDTSSGSLEIR